MSEKTVEINLDEWKVIQSVLEKVGGQIPSEEEVVCYEDERCEDCDCSVKPDGTVVDDEDVVEIAVDDWEAIQEAFVDLKESLEESEEQLESVLEHVGEVKTFDEKLEETLLEEGRIIYLHDEISEESAMHVTTLIHYFNEVDNKLGLEKEERVPIRIHISSPGGEVFKGFGIVSAIENSKTPVHTYSEGTQLMSMGFVIFLAGEKRFMSKHSNPMYHQISSGSIGSISSMDNDVGYYKRLQKKASDYILERTSIPGDKLRYYDERNVDWHLSFEECKEYKVLTNEI